MKNVIVKIANVNVVVPNKEAKHRKQVRIKINEWCNKYGRTAKQIERWKRNHPSQSIEPPKRY